MAAKYAGCITSNLKFTTKVPLLMKATSNDEQPTQGYDLQEISGISKSSLPNCQSLLSFLLGRLEKNDPRIKFKVLHLMKYLVINGHSEFRSQLRHNAEAVRQTVSYKGELDRVHGDGLNVKVQQAASDLEKLLFDVDNPEVEMICKSMLAPDKSSKIKEQGFGYTRTPEIKKEPSFMDALKKSGSNMFNMNKGKSKVPPSEYGPMIFPSPPQYKPVDMEDSEIQELSNSSLADGNDEEDEICDEIEMDSAHYYERKLVHNITSEGGMTKIPSKEMLKDFVNKSLSLDLPIILDLLDERLENSSQNVQLKSLCVVEYLLRSNLTNIPRQINQHCPSIHLLIKSQDQTVQAKANKIVLAVASCLKQEEEHTIPRVVPPSYSDAKEIPMMKDKNNSETEDRVAKSTDFDSLFSGMNLSTQRSSPVPNSVEICPDKHLDTESDSSILKTGTSRDSGANCKSVEASESLIDLENTAHILSAENLDIAEMLDTKLCNSKQNSSKDCKQTGRSVDSPSSVFNTQTSNYLDSIITGDKLNAFQASQAITCDTQLQALDAAGQSNEYKATARSGVLNSNTVDLLNWQSASNQYPANSTQNTEDLLILNIEQHKTNSVKTPPSHIHPHISPQPIPYSQNSDLLSFQTSPLVQTLPGGLVLPTNNFSSGPRRPFPKDMKSEVDGFDFIRKSSKADAFNFISDEIQASKTKPS